MKRSFYSSLILALSLGANVQNTAAQEQAYIAPLVTESLLLDMTNNSGQLVAVGERGHILLSDDGKEWLQQPVPSKATLTAVYGMNDNIWVVGHDAVILGSKDKGKSWQVQQFIPDLERPLLDVLFFDDKHGVAIGAYGVFFRTKDGGENWTREFHLELLHPDDQAYLEELKQEDEAFYQEELASVLPHLNAIQMVDGQLLMAGESGMVAFSDDLGVTWQRKELGYYGSFFDITKQSNGTIAVAGLRGSLFRSKDNGETWRRVQSDNTSTFNTLIELKDGGLLAAGNNGKMLWLNGDEVKVTQTKDGKALLSALQFDGELIAVSEVGVKTLQRDGK